MSEKKDTFLNDLFINEVKPALERWDNVGSGDDTNAYILVSSDGEEIPAVLVDEETVFDATANDIREGKVAATEEGVTVGTKVIPSYHTTEAVAFIPEGRDFVIALPNLGLNLHDFTELQAVICPYNSSISKSVKTEKVVIERAVYPVLSTDSLASVTVDSETKTINLGITNDSGVPYIIRYFTYKEIL